MSSAETELARIVGIIGAAEAAGRERLAIHLALNCCFSVDEARECLRASAEDHPSPAILAAMAEAAGVGVLQ
jgi:hypothetical protein